MANQEQIEYIKRDVSSWNTWRMSNPTIMLDFSDTDLSRVHLEGANLSRANLSRAHLNAAHLNLANLSYANLSGANLSGANLSGANLSGANLSGANLSLANLDSANLDSTNLDIAHFDSANLSNANLIHANLNSANLDGTNLDSANLEGTQLNNTHLNNADLSNAFLTRAILSNVFLSGAILKETRIGRTIFGDIDLRTVQGLETIHHLAPSTIGTDTILRSEGDIPEEFLRGAGLSDTFIIYARSLAQHPIEYYTCFISYSSHDNAFATRLYADLQHNGVRCWFAPEDMKIGDKIRTRIDESIRLYDKLLLVLSKHSIASNWVEYEVEAALAKERRENRTVLFPVRLDDVITQSTTAWAAHIQDTRHIGDFSHWKDHDAYQHAFSRLLRDLKAERSN